MLVLLRVGGTWRKRLNRLGSRSIFDGGCRRRALREQGCALTLNNHRKSPQRNLRVNLGGEWQPDPMFSTGRTICLGCRGIFQMARDRFYELSFRSVRIILAMVKLSKAVVYGGKVGKLTKLCRKLKVCITLEIYRSPACPRPRFIHLPLGHQRVVLLY